MQGSALRRCATPSCTMPAYTVRDSGYCSKCEEKFEAQKSSMSSPNDAREPRVAPGGFLGSLSPAYKKHSFNMASPQGAAHQGASAGGCGGSSGRYALGGARRSASGQGPALRSPGPGLRTSSLPRTSAGPTFGGAYTGPSAPSVSSSRSSSRTGSPAGARRAGRSRSPARISFTEPPKPPLACQTPVHTKSLASHTCAAPVSDVCSHMCTAFSTAGRSRT